MGDLVRFVMGVKGTFPYASALYLFCRGRDNYLTYSHDISLLSLHLMQEIGILGAYIGEEKMGIR